MPKRRNADRDIVPIPDDEATTKSAELRGKFKAAHAEGMNALKRHDYDALDRVINIEAQIIEAHSALIMAHQKEAAALSAKITANLTTSKDATKRRKRVS